MNRRINAEIIETGGATLKIVADNNKLLVRERDFLWVGKCDRLLLDFVKYDDFFSAHDGVWVTLDDDCVEENEYEYESKYIDVFCRGASYANQKFSLQKNYLKEGEYQDFLGVDLWNEEGVYISGIDGQVRKFRQGDFLPDLVRNDIHAYLRSREGEVICLNEQLESVWTVLTEKRCFSTLIDKSPQYSKTYNLVVVNVGEKTDNTRGEFELNAYAADSGELVWQKILESTPCTSNLIDDKVYVIVNKQLMVIDAGTGQADVNVKHGFKPFSAGTGTYQGAAYPVGSKLLCISPPDRQIQLRSINAEQILQAITIPDPYMPTLKAPVEHEGKVYLPLTHIDSFDNTMKGAFIVIELGGEGAGEITPVFEIRPPMSVAYTINDSGKPIYKVTIDHDHLDDVIRFSTIALKEIAFKHGSYTSSTDTNKEHHGQLLLQVKAEPLAMDSTELLDALAVIKERIERNLKETGVKAGDGSSDYMVEIELS